MRFANAILKMFRKGTKPIQTDLRFNDVLWNKRCMFKNIVAAIDDKLSIELPDCTSWRFVEDKAFDAFINGCQEYQVAAECTTNIVDILIDISPYLKRRQEVTFKYLPIVQSSKNKLDWLFIAKSWINDNITLLLDLFKDADDNPVAVTLPCDKLPRDKEAWPELVGLLFEKGMKAMIEGEKMIITVLNEQEVA